MCGSHDCYKEQGKFYVLLRNGNKSSPRPHPTLTPPSVCSNGRAQMLCCLSLCFSTYEESPAQNNMPLGRKRCFGVVSFAAISGMGFGALIRQLLLHQRWFCKANILSRPCAVYLKAFRYIPGIRAFFKHLTHTYL